MEETLFFFTMPSTRDHVTFFKLIKSIESKFLFVIIGKNINKSDLTPYKSFIKEHNKIAYYIEIEESKNSNGLEKDLKKIENKLNEIIKNNKIQKIIIDTTIGFGLYRTAYPIFLSNNYKNIVKLDGFYLGSKGDKYYIKNYIENFQYIHDNINIHYIKEPLEDYLFKINFDENFKYNKLNSKIDFSKISKKLLNNKNLRYFFRAYMDISNDNLYSANLKKYYKANEKKLLEFLKKYKNKIPEKNFKKLKGQLENFFNKGEKYKKNDHLKPLVKSINELIPLKQSKYQPIYKELKENLDKFLISINDEKIKDSRNKFLDKYNLSYLSENFDKNNKSMGFFFEDIIAFMFQKEIYSNDIHLYTGIELGEIEIDIALLSSKGEFTNVEIKTFYIDLKNFRSRIKVQKDNLGAKSKFYLIYPFISSELNLIKEDLEKSVDDIDKILPDYKKNWRNHFSAFYNYELDKDIEIIGIDEIGKIIKKMN